MANYEGNRIICNTNTKNALYKTGIFNKERYKTIDFDKALNAEQGTYDWAYEVKIKKIAKDSWDISFETRTHTDLETIYAFISKYRETEWYICYEFCENYHFYWYDGEVVEDVTTMKDEEEDDWQKDFEKYCKSKHGDNEFPYPVIFIPKVEQKKYINFRINKKSGAYDEYIKLVENCANKLIKDNKLWELKEYDYKWTGNYRHYGLVSSVRGILINEFKINTQKYKVNQMADEVVDKIESIKFPFSMDMQNTVYGFVLGEQVGEYSNKHRLKGMKIKDIDNKKVFSNRFGRYSTFLFSLLKCIKNSNNQIYLDKIERLFINEFKKDFNEFETLIAMIPIPFIECSKKTLNKYIGIFTNDKKIRYASLIYCDVLKCAINKVDYKIDKNDERIKEFKDLSRLNKLNEADFKWTEVNKDKYLTIDFLITLVLWAMFYEKVYYHDPKEPAVDGIKIIRSVECKSFESYILYGINSENDSSLSGALIGALAGIKEGNDYNMKEWMKNIDKSLIDKYLWKHKM